MQRSPGYDVPYAFELYTRISSTARVNGALLKDLLLDRTHNLWHCFAQSAFLDDCARFSVTKRFDDVAAAYRSADHGRLTLSYLCIGAVAFLVTLCALVTMWFGKRRALLFSVDRTSGVDAVDFRIERIYHELRTARAAYTEVFHTIIGAPFLRALLRRRRPAIYLEGIEWLFYTMRAVRRLTVGRSARVVVSGFEEWNEDERAFGEALVSKYINAAPMRQFRLNFFSWILSSARVGVILSIDDVRHYHELMIAASQHSIPSYAFQHGHITPYHVGWLTDGSYRGVIARSDTLVVWNDYWKNECAMLGAVWPVSAVVVGGNPKFAHLTGVRRASTPSARIIVIPYETHAPQETVRACIAELQQIPGVRVIIKVRPDISREEQLSALGGGSLETITRLDHSTDPITAVIGTYSSFLYDALEAGIPVGVLQTSLRFAERMVANGLAEPIELGAVARGIERLEALQETDTHHRQQAVASAENFSTLMKAILQEARLW